MIGKIKHWLIIAFLLLTVALLAWFKLTQPKILVLQSYDADYIWVRDTDAGIARVFKDSLRYRVLWHYMDTKRHPDADFKRRAGLLATREIENFRPDVIIAMDDDAQEYAAKQYANNPGVSIVFGGINGSVEPYGYNGAANVTGIYERKPLQAMLDALKALRRTDGRALGRRIVYIGDPSPAVVADKKEVEAMDWSPFKLAASTRAADFDEWKSAVNEASKNADLILVTNFQNIARAKGGAELAPPAQVIEWTEQNSKVPVIGLTGSLVEQGGMLAVSASGFEQGETMAHMAEEILEGKRPRDIPQAMPRQYLVYMRQALMKQRGLVLPDVYEAFARASNNFH